MPTKEKFSTQRKLSSVSHKRIVQRLLEGPKTFSELLETTGLSKPVLANHLRKMVARGVAMKEYSQAKDQVRYKLTGQSVKFDAEIAANAFAHFSSSFLKDLDGKEDLGGFLREFSQRVGVSVMFVLLRGIGEQSSSWMEQAIDMHDILDSLQKGLLKRDFIVPLDTSAYLEVIESFQNLYEPEYHFLTQVVESLAQRIKEINK